MTFKPNTFYVGLAEAVFAQLINSKSGTVLDLSAWDNKWFFENIGDGLYTIKSGTGKYLGLDGVIETGTYGAAIDTPSFSWSIEKDPSSNDSYRIFIEETHLSLDLGNDGSSANRTPVLLRQAYAPYQYWRFSVVLARALRKGIPADDHGISRKILHHCMIITITSGLAEHKNETYDGTFGDDVAVPTNGHIGHKQLLKKSCRENHKVAGNQGGLKGKLKGIFSKKATSAQSYSTSGVPSPTQLPLWPVDTKGNTKQASRVPSPTLLPSSSGDTKGNIAGNPKGGTKGNTGSGTVWNGVLSVLRVAQASLDDVPVPGLKSAIGGFLEVVGQLEKAEANAEAISQLQNNIEFFNRSVSDPLKQYAAKGPVPPEVAEAVEALSTQLVATITTLQSYRHKNSASLWANRDQIERDIRVAGIKIRDGVTAFLSNGRRLRKQSKFI
ncbi:uncharacterized protein EI90DRAFT_3014608 [Cantharellus anzutake]|uniref:uncharacterized protein n=1 Tax=Cantharellus anzutake TaxID=1750568 RepID=UPI0019079CE5|nr:uncharacterized protein EI90DRAFT_3014608 [Cantharellus anzutake]KAF8335343.1 hypothetical protein EI90DRAFT_3014608 [Cantharellus anzutake]